MAGSDMVAASGCPFAECAQRRRCGEANTRWAPPLRRLAVMNVRRLFPRSRTFAAARRKAPPMSSAVAASLRLIESTLPSTQLCSSCCCVGRPAASACRSRSACGRSLHSSSRWSSESICLQVGQSVVASRSPRLSRDSASAARSSRRRARMIAIGRGSCNR